MDPHGGPAVVDGERLRKFLASTLFVLPWLSWQAWILGASFRQRRGKPISDTNAFAGAAAAQAAHAQTDGTAPAAGTAASGATTDASSTVPISSSGVKGRWRPMLFVVGVSLLFIFAKAWLGWVLSNVPEPYLDEFFHIPQAQKYCEGKWTEWDNKITTPPGLYLFSVLYQGFWSGAEGCSVWALRGANNLAIMLVAIAACSCRTELEHQEQLRLQLLRQRQQQPTGTNRARPLRKQAESMFSLYAFHTSLNVALFPVLFFFSALYYTDVYSTLAVLVAYRNHLFRRQIRSAVNHANGATATPPFWNGLLTVVLGMATLLMRQTNIFWVVVYMGGLEVVQAVKSLQRRGAKRTTEPAPAFDTPWAMARFYAARYAAGDVHDPPVGASWPDDWALSLLSIGVAAICNPLRVLAYVWPYVVTLAGFAGFVVWNGGVVLGDKSNHVATLHLAQLLYLWPLFAFFTAPLFASLGVQYLRRGWELATKKTETEKETEKESSRTGDRNGSQDDDQGDSQDASSPPPPVTAAAFRGDDLHKNKLFRLLHVVFVRKAYYPIYLVAVFDTMLAVVHYNTIVHPFTLADNRHYMFYVFRYTIRRSQLLRYGLVPVYTACSWACWRVLGGRHSDDADADTAEFVSSPFSSAPRPTAFIDDADVPAAAAEETKPADAPLLKKREKPAKKAGKTAKPKANKDTTPTTDVEEANDTASTSIFLNVLDEDDDAAAAASMAAPPSSAALLWLLASSLSLVTAPLVEPRYFILPWVFWRLLVPAVPTLSAVPAVAGHTAGPSSQSRGFLTALGPKIDGRLVLETLWFVAINLATMYVFLFRPFVWQAADGSLMDDGRLQRFMW
ncbi:glucosyltransferase [Niveomyces insectorum RCEF 264]|uniref:Dol-P-Glc:Glc(2)Man(9)GlcNAc(2)-PP-Dol alpha-1,2-glucosyltransferase n=1 Tax=Niveomyces insectorum RCEF 264 TaxID=1081102 RepID=A0A167YPL0_9HYPO|nr:glucosyltransferase [Niveomyces insectorum RCEF 264]